MNSKYFLVLFSLLASHVAAATTLPAVPKNPEFSYQTTAQLFRSGLIADTAPFRVWYSSERVNGRHLIRSNFLYRKYLDEGLPVAGVNYYVGDPFRWTAPSLSIQISNTKRNIVALVGMDFDVEESVPDLRAIPVFRAFSKPNTLSIENFGWGALKEVTLQYGVVDSARCEAAVDSGGSAIELHEKKYDSIAESIDVDVSKEIPVALKNSIVVCAVGLLHYRDVSGAKRKIPFTTGINTVPPGPAAPSPPTDEYLLELQAGKVGRKSISIAQQVRPNDVDHFLVRVVSDKSARYSMKAFVRDTEGVSIGAGAFELILFVPRGREANPSYDAYIPISASTYSNASVQRYITKVSRNPRQRMEIAIIPTKSFFLASDSEREAVINALKDSLQALQERSLHYCIVRNSKCIQSGSMSWEK